MALALVRVDACDCIRIRRAGGSHLPQRYSTFVRQSTNAFVLEVAAKVGDMYVKQETNNNRRIDHLKES